MKKAPITSIAEQNGVHLAELLKTKKHELYGELRRAYLFKLV